MLPAAAHTRTLFLGSGGFAVPVLVALATCDLVRLVGVVTAPPRPAGRRGDLRPTPVAEEGARLGVSVLTPVRLRDAEAREAIATLRPELLVLADYGRLVPSELLALPRHGALNLHPSLLPRHRGASPIPAAILAGDELTGVTLMLMDEGLDTGPVVARAAIDLDGSETAPGLEARLARLAARLLLDRLPGWLAGELTATPQPTEGANLTRPLRREDGRLDPSLPAIRLARQVRALQPWPGSFLEAEGERLVVWAATAVPDREPGVPHPEPGVPLPGPIALVPWRDRLALRTADGLLVLDEVQPAGGRRMSGADHRRGRRGQAGGEASGRS